MRILILAIVIFGHVVNSAAPPQTGLVQETQSGITVTARPLEIIEISEYHILEVVYKNDSGHPVFIIPKIAYYYWIGIIDYSPKSLYLAPGEKGAIRIEYFGKRVGWYEIKIETKVYVLDRRLRIIK
ncbi:MAG: hypothetical protein U9N61_02765 [Euryarchaeota archaeon]|nr:hypothetical protein [Euryarchaeota archaeon]